VIPQSSAYELNGIAELSRGWPSLIVLQAEPVSEDTEAGQGDDLPEKLQLAVDLALAGAARDILIVPALPRYAAAGLGNLIATHVTTYKGERRAQALQAAMRELLRPHVEPSVLDDLVLFECF
jgi:hypothetical protein